MQSHINAEELKMNRVTILLLIIGVYLLVSVCKLVSVYLLVLMPVARSSDVIVNCGFSKLCFSATLFSS